MKTKKSQSDKIKLGVAIFLILVLVSVGLYNYRTQVDYNAYDKFFEIIGLTVEGIINALEKALCAINLCPGADTWGVIIALGFFLLVAWYISSGGESNNNKKENKKKENKENEGK